MKHLKFIFSLYLAIFFGVEELFAQTNFNPEYENIKSRVSYVPGIKVIRGQTQLIVPGHESFCPNGTVFKFNNGDIQVYNRRSSDGGETWNKFEHILEVSTYQYPEPDGEVVMFRSHNLHPIHKEEGIASSGRPEIRLMETNKQGVFEAQFYRSNDNGLNWTEEIAKIFLPEELNDWSGFLCRKITRIDDGSLIMSMHGKSEKKSRGDYLASVIRSTDRGRTWHYHSTIAFGLTEGVRSGGFNETSLLVLPEGRIISFMRSGTSYQSSLGSHNNNDPTAKMPFSYHRSTPIYMSVSDDGAETWSNADPVTSFGVWPDAVFLSNGIIAMSYGRPGNWLTFSNNEGESWGPIIPFYNGLYPPDCGNYLSLTEVSPGILLAVYARTDPNDHWKSEIVGTYFHVKNTSKN